MGLHIQHKLRRPFIGGVLGTFVILGGIISGLTVYGAISQTVSAATPPDSCFEFDIATGSITNYYDFEDDNPANSACPRDVDVPGMIGGVPVVAVRQTGFYSKGLTSVTLPNTLTTISDGAFGDNNLTSVVIPDSVILIDGGGFNSNDLETVVIGNGVQVISSGQFGGNPIKNLTIGSSSYNGIPTTVINMHAFSNMGIETLSLGRSVVTIQLGAFYDNAISTLNIPDTVTSIGRNAFDSNNLTSVSIPNSITTISDGVFSRNALTSVTIPDSVASIGTEAFSYNSLTSITIPDSVTTLGPAVFSYNNLTTIAIGNGVQLVQPSMFAGNPVEELTVGNDGYSGVPVTVIDDSGFIPTPTIKTLHLGRSVASVGYAAFAQSPLETVYVAGNPSMIFETTFQSAGNGSYIRLYATDPDFIAAHEPGGLYGSSTLYGYVLNPATYTVNYQSTNGNTLAPSITSDAGPTLTNYTITSNPTANFDRYYRGGTMTALTAPAVSGYVTPAGHSLALITGVNTYTFIYTATSPSSGSTLSLGSKLSQTGTNQLAFISIGVLLAVCSTSAVLFLSSKKS